uniref:Uncharacterized protein n=1 Tax=Pipistrellus kuhlii TaxID=59472 RepID=A0A7J8A800_PIPKU|nr:hypothetical protein mPipKuh1_009043 [Pipistrellus kuhlii]
MRDEEQQEESPDGLRLQAEERGGSAAGPREPGEIADQERAGHSASPGAAVGLRRPHQPKLHGCVTCAHASPGFPEAQLSSENPGGKQTAAGPSDTSTTYKTRCLSDVPECAELTEQMREVS